MLSFIQESLDHVIRFLLLYWFKARVLDTGLQRHSGVRVLKIRTKIHSESISEPVAPLYLRVV